MVGGKEDAFETAKPVFEAMGKNIVHCGPSGNGQRVKAVNQVICALNILAVSEGMLFAKRAGLDLETERDRFEAYQKRFGIPSEIAA